MKKIISLQILMAMILLIAGTQKLTAQSNVELWGTLSSGGSDNLGTIGHYELTTSTWTKDYDFTTPFPGGNPKRSQLTEVDGKQYGIIGGGAHGAGLLFEWDPVTNLYTKKFDFSPVNGSDPVGSLTYADGKLYGLTSAGGVYGVGVIFEWNLATNTYAKKVDFDNHDFGARPNGSLTYFDGKLYGMTLLGGAYSSGVIFEWNPATNICTKKFDFSGTNGTLPYGSLTYGREEFYGMTRTGGVNNVGVLFAWNPITNIYTKKFDFDGVNGSGPVGALTYDGEKFYGMTVQGGINGWGVLFEWNPLTNTFTKKVDFDVTIGAQPHGSLIYIGGKFYGTTFFGGSAHHGPGGVLFEWDPSTNVYTKKFNFNDTDGDNPFGSLNYSTGKLYGMTFSGGANNYGVIFQWDVATNGYSKKIDFNTTVNGSNPHGALAYVGGKFYGATRTGGAYGYGVLFEWDPQFKVYTKKIDFNKENGANPEGSLTYRDGKFYGLTFNGGISNEGVLFEWDPATNKYEKKVDFNMTIGSAPIGTLIEFDGKFYGIAMSGGATGRGVIFEWDPSSNIYKNRMNFMCEDGCTPQNSMTLVNGKFFGMTNVGGADNRGVIFEWNPVTGVYAKKVDLNLEIGGDPVNPLAYAEGKFYGTTKFGGASPYMGGVLFEWDPATNVYTKRVDLHFDFGAGGVSGSMIYSDDKFFGTSSELFSWNPITNEHIKKIDFNAETGVSPQQFLLIETTLDPVDTLTLPATGISFTNVHSTYMDVSFTPGNGSRHLVVMKAGSAPTFQPIDNTSYSGNLGNGESVVYNGTDSTFQLANLQPDTEYFITIFEFNSQNTTIRYLVDNPPLASKRTLKNVIDGFSLIYFKTREVVADFSETVTLDVADPDIKKYTIRANTTAKNVGSVKFSVDGVQINIDNSKPYTINYWVLPELSAGVHTLSTQAFSNDNAQGWHYEKRDAFIIITNSAAVTQFDIVDEDGNKIKSIFDGETINIGQPELQYFNVVARTNISTTRSVKFTLNDVTARIDNRAPYAVSGKANGNEKPWLIRPGNYTLTATPFMKYNAWGPPGIPLTINFTVINDALPSQIVMRDELLAGRENVTSGSAEELSSPQLHVYPTPVKDELHISLNDPIDGKVVLKVMDINGRSLYSMEGTAETIHGLIISTNQLGLSSGLYILCIQNQNGKILRTRFLKE